MITLAASWLHDLDPFLVRVGGFGVRWYGASYLLGFVIAYFMMRWMADRGWSRIPKQHVADAMTWLVGGVIVGGRLGYVLFYERELLWSFTDQPPWWGLLALNNGGMASHGGIIGVCVAAFRISRGFKQPDGQTLGTCSTLHITDVIAVTALPGLFLGRIANFINGELLGRVVSTPGEPGPWWGVKYPQEALEQWTRLPEAQQEQLAALAGVTPDQIRAEPGAWQQYSSTVYDLMIRIQSGGTDGAGAATTLEPLLSARHPSQLYQGIADGLIPAIVCWLVWARPRAPGVVGCAFLISYGIGRILTETVRLPDAHFEVSRIAGLSRGQWLSVGMASFGLGMLLFVVRRSPERIGGWRSRREDQLATDSDEPSSDG